MFFFLVATAFAVGQFDTKPLQEQLSSVRKDVRRQLSLASACVTGFSDQTSCDAESTCKWVDNKCLFKFTFPACNDADINSNGGSASAWTCVGDFVRMKTYSQGTTCAGTPTMTVNMHAGRCTSIFDMLSQSGSKFRCGSDGAILLDECEASDTIYGSMGIMSSMEMKVDSACTQDDTDYTQDSCVDGIYTQKRFTGTGANTCSAASLQMEMRWSNTCITYPSMDDNNQPTTFPMSIGCNANQRIITLCDDAAPIVVNQQLGFEVMDYVKLRIPSGCTEGVRENPPQWDTIVCHPDEKVELTHYSDAACTQAENPATSQVILGTMTKQTFPPGGQTPEFIFDARCSIEGDVSWFEMWTGAVFVDTVQRTGSQTFVPPSDLQNNADGGLTQISTGNTVTPAYNVDIQPVIKNPSDPGYADRVAASYPKPAPINSATSALATLFIGLLTIFAF